MIDFSEDIECGVFKFLMAESVLSLIMVYLLRNGDKNKRVRVLFANFAGAFAAYFSIKYLNEIWHHEDDWDLFYIAFIWISTEFTMTLIINWVTGTSESDDLDKEKILRALEYYSKMNNSMLKLLQIYGDVEKNMASIVKKELISKNLVTHFNEKSEETLTESQEILEESHD